MNKNEFIETFIQEAKKHGEAINHGEHKTANKVHKKIHTLYKFALANKIEITFLDLMDNEDENVQLWAAVCSLKYSKLLAEKKLQDLSNLSTIVSLTATLTLKLWKEGKLELLD